MVHACAGVKENSVQFCCRLDGNMGQIYGALWLSEIFDLSPPSETPRMKNCDVSHCAVCGETSVDRPRLFVEQDRHYDCPLEHGVGLCQAHGEALRCGEISPQEILYAWVRRHHEELYDGTRIHLVPRMSCLGCNAM